MPDVAAAIGYRRLGDVIDTEVPNRLRMSWAKFIRSSGLGRSTIYDLRAGTRTSYESDTLARLEAALRWNPGSVERVLRGGDPDRIEDAKLARVLKGWPDLTPEVQALIADLVERSAER